MYVISASAQINPIPITASIKLHRCELPTIALTDGSVLSRWPCRQLVRRRPLPAPQPVGAGSGASRGPGDACDLADSAAGQQPGTTLVSCNTVRCPSAEQALFDALSRGVTGQTLFISSVGAIRDNR